MTKADGGTGLEIAVIGMSGRFPGAKHLDEFWENLKHGVESLRFYTEEELERCGVDLELLRNPDYVKAGGGILEDIDYFDAGFFGYSPNEAMMMDPQMRIFHECAWEALEHAGYDPGTYNKKIGVYAGASTSFKWEVQVSLSGKVDEVGRFAVNMLASSNFLCTRLAYKLNLKGPSYTVQTACSTSLVAIVLACQGILTGQCNMALAGGVSVSSAKGRVSAAPSGYIYKEGMVRSADGHCRAFDVNARGTVAGEGVGVVILKLLEEAIADRDTIHAVIKGFAINNDGSRKVGYTAPSIEGQAEVIQAAHLMAEIEPGSITYIETHGTGTVLGDMAEVEALKQAFPDGKKGTCGIGSLKTNIGHLDAAAGVAAFIKVVLALKHRQLPPSLNFENPDPRGNLINTRFYVNAQLTGWERDGHPLRAGVSSFGIGGTNAHVVLEEFSEGTRGLAPLNDKVLCQGRGGVTPPVQSRQNQLILLSAKTPTALDTMKKNLANYLRKYPGINLTDMAYTLQVGRKPFSHRWMTIGSNVNETIETLTAPEKGESHTILPGTREENPPPGKTGPASTLNKDSLTRIGRLWLHGHKIDWKDFYPGEKRHRIPLPTYPFERQRYWLEESDTQLGTAVKGALSRGSQPYQESMADWFYIPNWKRSVLSANNHVPAANKGNQWLVLMDSFDLGTLIVNHLQDLGDEVAVVTAGAAYSHPGQQRYTINPRQPQDYKRLLEDTGTAPGRQNRAFFKVLHLWTITGSKMDKAGIEELQTLGFYSLLNLVKAIKETSANSAQQSQLIVISDHWHDVTGEETLEPAKSTMLGALAVIPQEYPNIRCRSIDVVLPGSGSKQQDILVHQLLTEVKSCLSLEKEPAVAFRGPYRLVQNFEPLHLEEVEPDRLPLREKGVYLITGGTGNIGLTLAEYLAKGYKARLILTGRSPIPSKSGAQDNGKIEKIRKLETLGAEVMTFSCDAAEEEGMKAVISAAEQRWGRIHGIIHSAGLIRGSTFDLLDNLTPGICQQQFKTKIDGTLLLEKLFRDKPLDFCWLMSSISTVLGGLRYTAYAAANAFTDAFACQVKRNTDRHWISVDWDGTSKENTVEAFKRILSLLHAHNSISRLVVSAGGNLQARIDQWIKLESLQPKKTASADKKTPLYPRPQLFNAYEPPTNHSQEMIAETWKSVFGFDRIGIQDDFLELGGDSLKAITLISALHQQFNVKIPLPDFFHSPTVGKLAEYIQSKSTTEISSYSPVLPLETKEYYPLSSAQKRIYFLQQIDLSNTVYNLSLVLPLEKQINPDRLETTIKKLISRHESLRTSFRVIREEPVQRIHPGVEFAIEYFDLKEVEVKVEVKDGDSDTEGTRGLAPLRIESAARLINSFIRSFDLSKAPLIRSGLIRLPDNNYTWLLDLHHIISDGTSWTILTEDFRALYDEEELTPLVIQYKDFSHWQNRRFENGKIEKQEQYWLELYQDDIPRINLPTDFKRPEVFTFAGDICSFTLEPEIAVRFKALGAGSGGTLYMNILAALNILFYKYTGQEDIIIGTGIAGRNHAELQSIVGMFVNTLAMRNYPHGEKIYHSFLKEVIARSLQAFENQDVQFEELVERLDPERDPSRNPLFDITMVVQNFRHAGEKSPGKENPGQAEVLPWADESPASIGYQNPVSRFDMTIFVRDSGKDVRIAIEYYTGIFRLSFIQRFASHLRNVIEAVVREPGIKLKDIEILTAQEKRQVLYEFNLTHQQFPPARAIHGLIEEQVRKSPDTVAIAYENQALTYGELEIRANQLARYLYKNKTLKPEERVGIFISQSLDRVISLIGILKAGGSYVPLDPSLPVERLKYMIDNAQIGVVLSEKSYIRDLNRLQWECKGFHTYLCLDSSDIHAEDEQETNELMNRDLWHHVADTAADDITAGGWLSSYTEKPFSRREMDEYGDNTLKKLEPLLHPRMRVLEIGCASGITMYRIAPEVGLYYGTDLSSVIIKQNRERSLSQGHKNIKLSALAAHEIDAIEENNFDLIIMNSVIQCFHGLNYLRKVLRKAIALLGDTGYLFIGDVMDQDKKDALVQEMTTFKYHHREKNYDTKTDFSSELFVAKGFWEDLAVESPGIKIQFSNKIYTLENELTKFRYDVLIEINKKVREKKVYSKQKYQEDSRAISNQEMSPLKLEIRPDSLVYVIYTSGTTGFPKGVMIEHRSLINFIYSMYNHYHGDFSPQDLGLSLTNLSFDVSVGEIFMPLVFGAGIVLLPYHKMFDPVELAGAIVSRAITFTYIPPGLLEEVCRHLKCSGSKISMNKMLVGVEPIKNHTLDSYLDLKSDIRIVNGYGPTEATICATAYIYKPGEPGEKRVPIGTPLHNTAVFLLDKYHHPVPLGIGGELCISGRNLARGYINNPELTAESFCLRRPGRMLFEGTGILKGTGKNHRQPCNHATMQLYPHHSPQYPITPSPHHPIYRTGDLARWLIDGNIEFLGRTDFQVKIRGFRIELGEIESQLIKHHDIKKALVINRESETGDNYLCAYIVPYSSESTGSIDTTLLAEYLAETLPAYMIPAFFVLLEEIPLTPNGKIHRKALPEPVITLDEGYAPPTNEIEKKLAAIWSEILGVQKTVISRNDNFFNLGGHSLKATVLAARIHKEMNIKIPLAEIFKTPTIKGMFAYLNQARKERYGAIEPGEKKEYYVQSSAQKRMYILQQMEPGNINYNMPQFFLFTGPDEKEKLRLILKQLTARHESLRTSFHMVDDQPVQRIHDQVTLVVSEEEPGEAILQDFVRPFDLTRAPLLRVGLVETEPQNYLLMIDMHHIISDALSQGILAAEFPSLFEGRDLLPLRLQYRDYAQWQQSPEQQFLIKQQEAYWLKEFSDELPVLELPADYPRPTIQSFAGDTAGFVLDATATQSLKKLGENTNATLFMTILAVLQVLLAKLSGQEDIIVGTPIAGRRHDDLKKIIGMFVNTLPLRSCPAGEKTFTAFLHETKNCTLEALENQDYQFEDLVEKVKVSRDTGRNPVFDVLFNFLDRDNINNAPGIKDQPLYQYKKNTAKFDLTLTVLNRQEDLLCSFEYCTRLFTPKTIDRITGYFKKIFDSIFENPGQKLSEIEIITAEEKSQILYEFNDTDVHYPKDKTLNQILAEQVERTPDNIAIIGPSVSVGVFVGAINQSPLHQITYKELNQKSNQLAYELKEKGIKPDTIVGIMMERSIDMIIGILGILKASGAYLPIDPDYPPERINYMIADSNTKFLVTTPGLTGKIKKLLIVNCQLLIVNEKLPGCPGINNPPKEANSVNNYQLTIDNLQLECSNLAYVIYTSGTTGKPKGVLIRHLSVVRLMVNDKFFFDFNENDVWTLFHSACFDFSVWEMYGALIYGGKLVIVPKILAQDTERFLELLKEKQVTVLNQTPPAFYQLAHQELKQPRKELNIRTIIFGGEALAPARLRQWKQKYPTTKLINMYGITETTVHSTLKEITKNEIETNTSNIGKPIPTLKVYLMDMYLKPVPIGVAGELWAAGPGTARGYLNRPELTAEKFCHQQPWGSTLFEGTRGLAPLLFTGTGKNHLPQHSPQYPIPPLPHFPIYRSGDLARWLHDGNIEFLGRIDQQVKIRGFRIEPGEIENRLSTHPDVKEAVVIVRVDATGDRFLSAYFVTNSKGNEIPTSTQLKQFLSQTLPEYMIPAYFIRLEKIPLTSNGKIHRQALPEPGLKPGENDTPPRNETEEKLAAIWSEVLANQGNIGIDDNFFTMGGHSLKATVLANKILQILQVRIPLIEIFRIPTIRQMADWIANTPKTQFTDIEKVTPKDYYELSFNQKRLWVLNQLEPESPAFHIPETLVLKHQVNEEAIKKTLDQLVRHHESLRTGFQILYDEPRQFILEEVELSHQILDISTLDQDEKQKQRNRIYNHITKTPFQLNQPPLFRSALIKSGPLQYEFMFNLHHIIADGWSMEILKRDFSRVYQGFEKGEPLHLTPPKIQYKDFAAMHNRQLKDPVLKKQAHEYWKKKLHTGVPPMKFHGTLKHNLSHKKGAAFQCVIPHPLKEKLKQVAKQKNTSLFMVMFSVYMLFLSRFTGQQDIACSFISAGRENAALHDIIGFFVNSVIFITHTDYQEKFADFLQRLNQDLLEILEYQSYPLELVFEDLQMRYPYIPVSFNMLNLADTTTDLELKTLQPHHIEETQDVKFDLEPYITEYENGIRINWAYDKNLFTPSTIEYMAGVYIKLLDYFSTHLHLNYNSFKDKTEKPTFKRKK